MDLSWQQKHVESSKPGYLHLKNTSYGIFLKCVYTVGGNAGYVGACSSKAEAAARQSAQRNPA